MKKILLILLIFFVGIFASCTKYEYIPQNKVPCSDGSGLLCPANVTSTQENTPVEKPVEKKEEILPDLGNETEKTIETPVEEIVPDITVTEGELVEVSPKVTDPDGDVVTLTFEDPLNSEGKWQTKVGDAGTYKTVVSASDGKATTTTEYVILVKEKNKAPVIEFKEVITVKEGERIVLAPKVTDKEGDNTTLIYSGWMKTQAYLTTYDDAGEHKVEITADDGLNTVKKEIKIIVENVNRKPELTLKGIKGSLITLTEGDFVKVEAIANDPDGDDVTVKYSEPLDSNGEWDSLEGDAGEYVVTVTVSDGNLETSQEILISVNAKNKAPVFEKIETVNVNVGGNLKDYIKPVVEDPEGDPVLVSYSGWKESIDYVTTEKDAGEHTLTITYSDSENEVSQDVTVNVNRPPVFVP
ncbi:MAG: hypothetical protein V1859_01040 [archaeon]